MQQRSLWRSDSGHDLIATHAQLGSVTDHFFYMPNALAEYHRLPIDEGHILGDDTVLCSRSRKLFCLQKACISVAPP